MSGYFDALLNRSSPAEAREPAAVNDSGIVEVSFPAEAAPPGEIGESEKPAAAPLPESGPTAPEKAANAPPLRGETPAMRPLTRESGIEETELRREPEAPREASRTASERIETLEGGQALRSEAPRPASLPPASGEEEEPLFRSLAEVRAWVAQGDLQGDALGDARADAGGEIRKETAKVEHPASRPAALPALQSESLAEAPYGELKDVAPAPAPDGFERRARETQPSRAIEEEAPRAAERAASPAAASIEIGSIEILLEAPRQEPPAAAPKPRHPGRLRGQPPSRLGRHYLRS